jgi:tetratricopeptide (TPR) repeat protein
MLSVLAISCADTEGPSRAAIEGLNLKRGDIITCSPGSQQLGNVVFEVSDNDTVQKDFNLGLKLLHSFEYDEAEKAFAKIIDEDPRCAMAYWGVAMSNFHPLWTPPTTDELKKGAKAVALGRSIKGKSRKETAWIDAIGAFYQAWDKVDHATRCVAFEKAMENLYTSNPTDREAAVFYALALDAAAEPADKSYQKQKKAGAILSGLYPGRAGHPGIIHYIIHTYDYPGLAELALPAAREYAHVAPSSAHALHMPSHIFTRLGLWDESIRSNRASVASAQCYASSAGIKGHWDEELHGLDYLMYAFLQKGANDSAKALLDYVKTIAEVKPTNFKVTYAFASIPARYVLENRQWQKAAVLQLTPAEVPWDNFPWQQAITHFARARGNVQTGQIDAAKAELKQLNRLHDLLLQQKDQYKANQVAIQAKAVEGWIALKEGRESEALQLMQSAADMEDKTGKHPVTPGEVLPARELLGDMYSQLHQWDKALGAFEDVLKKSPNRFNAVYNAGLAAEKSGKRDKAAQYYRLLLAIVGTAKSDRPEVAAAKRSLSSIGAMKR